MTTGPLNEVIQHLLTDTGPDGAGVTDGELLARFLRSRDGDALAALVRRHSTMVWGVCCRLLRNQHDAEDAFQATFLVLFRKAQGVPGQAVANWLYGVARQTAVRVRATAAKRRRRESQVVSMPEPIVAEARDNDLHAVLDEELGRLPDHYRGVIVLCDLEDMTRKEAARQLGIPEGSVASRLARARAFLARRLARRGVVLPGTVTAVLSASAPPALVASTIEAASALAVGKAAATGVISVNVAALTDGVIRAMFMTKFKSALAVIAVLVVLGAGGTSLAYHLTAGRDGEKLTTDAPAGRTAAAQEGKNPGAEKPQTDNNHPAKDPKKNVPPGVAPPARPEDRDAQADAEARRLRGKWAAAEGTRDGKSLTKEELGRITLVFNGPQDGRFYSFTDVRPLIDDPSAKSVGFSLQPWESPKQFLIDRNVGGKAYPHLGIYELDSDTFRFCVKLNLNSNGPANWKPPKEFAAPEGSGLMLLTLKRVKEK